MLGATNHAEVSLTKILAPPLSTARFHLIHAPTIVHPMIAFALCLQAMIQMAIDMHKAMQQINEEFGHGLRLRIGMHSGSVLGGIMGTKKLNFDLWGETVEMVIMRLSVSHTSICVSSCFCHGCIIKANKMEEHGLPERIHVSETT